MKKAILILFHSVYLISLFSYVCQAQVNSNTQTFQLCEVKKAEKPFEYGQSYDSLVAKRFTNEIRDRRNPEKITRPRKYLLATGEPAQKDNLFRGYTHSHSLIDAAFSAYELHYPLTLSPDAIWFTILQGVNEHIQLNAEKLRHHFVTHTGKKNIHVNLDGHKHLPPKEFWEATIRELTTDLHAEMGENFTDLLATNFSTTDKAEQIAFQIVMLDIVGDYFTFSGDIRCGIPEIILEGTTKDWKLLQKRVKQLAQYDLAWWVDDLQPILKEFVKASKGNFRKEFWQGIFQDPSVGCGSVNITGWLLKFFPYTAGKKNPLIGFDFEQVRKDNAAGKKHVSPPYPDLKEFSGGMAKVEFILDNNTALSKHLFYSGFIGVHQDPKTLALSPVITWLVIDTGEEVTEEDLKDYDQLRPTNRVKE